LLFAASCASTLDHFILEHRDAWIGSKEDGLADLVCFETRFEEYDDEKERLDILKKKEEKLKKKEFPVPAKEAKDSQ